MDKKKDPTVEEILGRINGRSDSAVSRGYEFSYRDENGGLVFEFSDADSSSRESRIPTPAPAPAQAELHFPDTFTVDERYDTPAGADIAGSIRTPYVPRFTEVSENYRMIDDPRPRKVAEVVEVTHAERVDTAEPATPASAEPAVDPTAELDVESESAVVVTSGRTAVDEDVSETLNIYKFGEPASEPVQRERTVEDERADITRLFIKNGETPVAEPASEPVAESATPTPSAPRLRRAEDYRIPDPVDPRINVVDFTADAHVKDTDVDPEGVTDVTSESEGKKPLEFTNKKQRDSFKDRFLDTLMSMRIRIVTAIIFGFALLALECAVALDLFVKFLPGLALTPWSYAVFDLILVVCMTLLALPEISSAVKRLLRGTAAPEISVLLGLVSIVGYTVAVLAVQPMSYPLFGFLYAISAFSVIAASYAKVRADFASFKLVTKNDEKRILDNKLTRSLPAENMALDGLVEEYKSRTARIFRTSFVSDFFKNSARSAESAKHAGLLLALSVISAITVGAVAFFLPSGGAVSVISALSALSLVLLLSYPAIAILSHKVPYMLAQRAAIAEDSTVIG